MERKDIIERFFLALDRLKDEKVVRGLNTICVMYHINRRNLIQMRNDIDGHRGILNPSWLSNLANDFKVSPTWLLLGEGSFYRDGWDAESVKKLQKHRKEENPTLQFTDNE